MITAVDQNKSFIVFRIITTCSFNTYGRVSIRQSFVIQRQWENSNQFESRVPMHKYNTSVTDNWYI